MIFVMILYTEMYLQGIPYCTIVSAKVLLIL